MHSIARCLCLKRLGHPPGLEDHFVLASETSFTVNEVDALHILYEKLSNSIIEDDLIHKEEFQLALLNRNSTNNIFTDRLFDLFDLKRNGVIEFGEFVRSLSIFHPKAPEADKIEFAFRLYDLNHSGYIERDELKDMVLAFLSESNLTLEDDLVEAIVDKTLLETDLKGDGKIDLEEWKEMVSKHPSLIKNMTLQFLEEITLAFPSFVMKTRVHDSDLIS